MKAILVGATGRMGQSIARLSEAEGLTIVAQVGLGAQYADITEVSVGADVIIDFSTPKIIDSLLGYAMANNTPIFIGTTGHSAEQKKRIEAAGQKIPVCLASNTSVGVITLFDQVRTLAKKLNDWDVEIFEKHHNQKKDSPSGTALSLAHNIIQERPELEIITDRTNNTSEREKNELGVTAIRAGSIVGEHTVYFVKNDEVVEITHRALSRDIFARGAITMSKKLSRLEKGFYTPEGIV